MWPLACGQLLPVREPGHLTKMKKTIYIILGIILGGFLSLGMYAYAATVVTSFTAPLITSYGGTGTTTTNNILPSQTGNSGKYLTTNGLAPSWGTVSSASSTLLSDTNTWSALQNFANILVTGSTTLQNFTANNATTTNATSTSLFATTASTTKLFGANLQACTGTNALTYSGGLFGCTAVPQGTVTSVATDATLTGGPITTTGTLGLNLANANWWTALQNFTNASTSQLTATSSVYLATIGGKVGVATTSPSQLFSVQGNGYFTGGLGVGLINASAGTIDANGGNVRGNLISKETTDLNGAKYLSFERSDNLIEWDWEFAGGASAQDLLFRSNNRATLMYFARSSNFIGFNATGPIADNDGAGSTGVLFEDTVGANYMPLNVYDDTAYAAGTGGGITIWGQGVSAKVPLAQLRGINEGTGNGRAGDFAFYTHQDTGAGPTFLTEKMRILANGNVGIGTTSAMALLTVATPNGSTGSLKNLFVVASSTPTATSTLLIVKSSGNIGISTSTPYNKLTIWGDTTTAGIFPFLVSNSASTTEFSIDNAGTTFISTKLGIGTTTPFAALSVGGTSTIEPFAVATSTGSGTLVFGVDDDGHTYTGGSAPAITLCGTGTGTVVGDDQSGTITTATAAAACTLTFSKAYKQTPVCTVTDNSLVGFADVSAISTTAVTFGISSALTGGLLFYQCGYHRP